MNLAALVKTKTFWAGVSAILGAVGGAASGEIAWGTALPMITTALVGIFLRDGIEKKSP